MAWPPTINTAVPNIIQAAGYLTAVWGTQGMMGNTGINGTGSGGVDGEYIVKSVRASDTNEVIYIENGHGLRAGRIMLWQGREVDITVIDDTGAPRVRPGMVVTIYDPISHVSSTFKVVDNGDTATRKAEGERTIRAVVDFIVDGTTPSSANW